LPLHITPIFRFCQAFFEFFSANIQLVFVFASVLLEKEVKQVQQSKNKVANGCPKEYIFVFF
jgi:hypothetical protein